MIATIVLPIALKIFMKGVSSKLWFWVNAMQLLESLSLLALNMPQNVIGVQKEYHSIVNINFKALLQSTAFGVSDDKDEND